MLHFIIRCIALAVTIGDASCAGPTVAVEFRSKGGMVRSHLAGIIGLEVGSESQLESRRKDALLAPIGNLTTGGAFADVHDDLGWTAVGHRVLGLALAFLNISLSSVGFLLQRKACLEEMATSGRAQADVRPLGAHCPHPLWLVGVALYVLASVPDLMAYTLIPQVLCSSVGCFRVVIVCLLGYSFLGECLKRREVVGIVICTFGALLCIRYGPGDETKLEKYNELHHQRLACYVIAGVLSLGVLLVIVHSKSLSKLHSLALPFAAALAFGLEKVFNSELGYVSMPEDLLRQPLWLSLVGGVAFLGLVDFYLNLRAAQQMPLYVYVPLSFAFGACVQNFQSLVILSELADMKVYRVGFTLLGASLAVVGALVIQPPNAQESTKHQS